MVLVKQSRGVKAFLGRISLRRHGSASAARALTLRALALLAEAAGKAAGSQSGGCQPDWAHRRSSCQVLPGQGKKSHIPVPRARQPGLHQHEATASHQALGSAGHSSPCQRPCRQHPATTPAASKQRVQAREAERH